MPWRRLTSFEFGGSPPPRPSYWCNPPGCCSIHPWVRTRITTWVGNAKTCGVNIRLYDSEQELGYYGKITGSYTRRYVRLGVTVGTCPLEVEITAPGTAVKQSEPCGDVTIETIGECEVPPACANPPGCTIEGEEDVTYTGSDEVTESAVAAKAAEVADETVGEWGDFVQTFPNIVSGLFATDNRGLALCSYRRTKLEIEVRGQVRPYLIEWQDSVTDLGPGGTTTLTARSLTITGPGVYEVEWNAGADQRVTGGQGMVSIEY
jgi:hypothetical protein